ncbi:hypothetical protein QJS04_geneDACA018389 [Acorus gramineus]|uniref:Uncharacterized protein n=1 Tax=Acorus gramineus TaxID=55184 RepID=A0AAV9AF25_ACOGR|nr:hypothetical protein QJS04_geneDACA018389 [Acorus gramineus]
MERENQSMQSFNGLKLFGVKITSGGGNEEEEDMVEVMRKSFSMGNLASAAATAGGGGGATMVADHGHGYLSDGPVHDSRRGGSNQRKRELLNIYPAFRVPVKASESSSNLPLEIPGINVPDLPKIKVMANQVADTISPKLHIGSTNCVPGFLNLSLKAPSQLNQQCSSQHVEIPTAMVNNNDLELRIAPPRPFGLDRMSTEATIRVRTKNVVIFKGSPFYFDSVWELVKLSITPRVVEGVKKKRRAEEAKGKLDPSLVASFA